MTQDVEGSEMTKIMKGRALMSLSQMWAAGAAIVFLASLTQACATREPPLAQSPASRGTVVTVAGEALPRCSEVEKGPQCPFDDKGSERNGSLVFFDFDERDFGGAPQCTCGELVLRNCNEDAPAGEPDSCAGGELMELPVVVEAIKNVTDTASTTCETYRGRRDCSTSD